MNYHEFSVDNVIGHDKVLYEQHQDLYVIESLEQLKTELARYFDSILERARASNRKGAMPSTHEVINQPPPLEG